jgi:succinyl-CoA synthetase beta subunit
MYLHEAQAKALLAQHGIAIPRGHVAQTAEEARDHATALGCACAVKALIHAGGRGLAGGVRFADTPDTASDHARSMLDLPLVTSQTRQDGEIVRAVYIEEALDFDRALYLSLIIDQRRAVPVLLASAEGGVELEEKAVAAPAMVQKYPFAVDGTHNPAALAAFLDMLGVPESHGAAVRGLVEAMLRCFLDSDASLIEINPLALTSDGAAVAVDAKIVLDGNALFRHPEFEPLQDTARADEREMVAQANEINFVRMDGDIGLVVNGAGLGLATHDMVIAAGGRPANFMDIRTMATAEQIATGIGLLLDDPGVRVLLVNVHGGGMTTCDRISDALAIAARGRDRMLPVVFRVAGQNAEEARVAAGLLAMPCTIAHSMTEAVEMAVGSA